jgi:hypothetical protein
MFITETLQWGKSIKVILFATLKSEYTKLVATKEALYCISLSPTRTEFRWGTRFSALCVHPASHTMCNGSLSQGYRGWSIALTTHPHLAPRLKKEYSYTSGPGLRSLQSDSLRNWRSGNRIPVWTRYSAPVQTGPGVKRPGRGVDHPPPSSAKVEGRLELYIYSPSGHSWPVLDEITAMKFNVLIMSNQHYFTLKV